MAGQWVALRSLEESDGCAEWNRLLRQFISATGDLIAIQIQTLDSPRLGTVSVPPNPIMERAVIEKLRARHALVRHMRCHRNCGAPEWMAE